MKSVIPPRNVFMATLLAAALWAPTWAQNAAGAGAGPGPGPGAGAGPGPGAGMGPAARPGPGHRAMRFDQGNTFGWTLMSPQERNEHQSRMRSVTSYDECIQLQQQHRQTMQERANDKKLTLRQPRQNVCDVMRARGLVP